VISFHPVYLVSKLAELGVIILIFLVGILYLLTLSFTGWTSDNLTRHPFLSGNLPNWNEDFSFAIFKLGQVVLLDEFI
jgi:cadmium resistance protein CadD (predicted permease)